MEAIPRETAWQLCQEIRHANRGKWYTSNGLQCLACSLLSRGDPERRRFSSKPGCLGCGQVNARYETVPKTPTAETAVAVVEPEAAVEEPNIIYLPPAGYSTMRRLKSCVRCGRQFRITSGQPDAELCPTCDYRLKRGELIRQDTGNEDADELGVE